MHRYLVIEILLPYLVAIHEPWIPGTGIDHIQFYKMLLGCVILCPSCRFEQRSAFLRPKCSMYMDVNASAASGLVTDWTPAGTMSVASI